MAKSLFYATGADDPDLEETCWPIPGPEMTETVWRLAYDEHATRHERLKAQSVMGAYINLLTMPRRARERRIAALRRVMDARHRAAMGREDMP
jgi:hypothetical protein